MKRISPRPGQWSVAVLAAAIACVGTHPALAQVPTEPSWQAWGGTKSLNGDVRALTTWDPDGPGHLPAQLVVGGEFTSAGGVALNGVARWDGAAWRPFGSGLSTVIAFTTWDPDGSGPLSAQLVAGGAFGAPGGVPLNSVARWDGEAWQPFGSGVGGGVFSLTTWDPDSAGPLPAQVVAGGGRFAAGGSIARWDGAAWLLFGSGSGTPVHALAAWDPDGAGALPDALFVAGAFMTGTGSWASGVGRWDGAAWQLSGGATNDSTDAMVIWDPDGPGPIQDALVIGCRFTLIGGVAIDHIARWDGAAWHPFGSGVNGSVIALTTWDPDGPGPLTAQLVAGGTFTTAGGVPANRVARWDGAAWQPFGSGVNYTVNALTAWDPDGPGPLPAQVVAGGAFTYAGGNPASKLATWSVSNPLAHCPADFNLSGDVSTQDIFDFLSAYFAHDPSADVNGQGGVSVQDLLDFLTAYFTACV